MTFFFFFFLPIPSFLSVEYLLLSSIPHRRRKRLSFSRQHAPLETSATVVCRAFGPEENKLGPQCRVTVPAKALGLTHSQTSVLPPSRGSRRLHVPSRWCATSSKSGARAPKGRQMRSIAALALRPRRPLQSPPGWFSPHAVAVGRVLANGVLAPRVEKRRAGIPPLSPGARGQRHPSACSLTSPSHRLVRTHLPGSMTKGFLPLLSSLSPGWSMLSV